MHPKERVDEARRLYATGLTAAEVAHRMHLPWKTVAHWCRGDRRESALAAVLPASRASSVQRVGCAAVKSYSTHWTCLFPQHGAGRKHERPIVLEQWQQHVVNTYPGQVLRGLSNKSLDILALCCAGLDRLGIAHRRLRWHQVSVARREAVAALDIWVGPKT